MNDQAVIKSILLLKTISGIGDKKILEIIKFCRTKEIFLDLFNKSNIGLFKKFNLTALQFNQILNPCWDEVNRQLSLANKYYIEIMSIFDDDYPKLLRQIYDPPVILYIKGNKRLLSAQLFAIVGTRNPTFYGKSMAQKFSHDLLACGYIVTSGFARGVDITAHMAVVNQGQPTVVVLGTSLDCVYPKHHEKYVQAVIESNGVIISENPFTTYPHASVFPKRNRIISGLSQGVLVVEAARKSGSLITARTALEQSREVFVIPGNINNPQALGCLDLIKDGAKLTLSIDDILDEFFVGLGMQTVSKNTRSVVTNSEDIKSADVTMSQQKIINCLKAGSVSFDDLTQQTSLTASDLMADLTQLEIIGVVLQQSDGYVLCN